MSGWADIKEAARRTVHETFRRAATYADPCSIDDPVDCHVRWHSAGARIGDLGGSMGYAELVAQADTIVFDRDELALLGVTPQRNGIVAVAGMQFRLDTKSEKDGPVTETWTAART